MSFQKHFMLRLAVDRLDADHAQMPRYDTEKRTPTAVSATHVVVLHRVLHHLWSLPLRLWRDQGNQCNSKTQPAASTRLD